VPRGVSRAVVGQAVSRVAPPVAVGLVVGPGEPAVVPPGAARRALQQPPAVVAPTEIAGWVAVRVVAAPRAAAEVAVEALTRAAAVAVLDLAGVAEIAGWKLGTGVLPAASAWQAAGEPAVGSAGLTRGVAERAAAKLAVRVGDATPSVAGPRAPSRATAHPLVAGVVGVAGR
jgi:hypothetical protein